MKTPFVIFCLLAVTASVFADPYVIAKQRARQTAEQNNNEQRKIQQAAADASPADPALQATLQNIGDLQVNFATFINSDSQPDGAQKASLLNNLTQAAQGTKAATADVKKLAADLTPVLAGRKKITGAQQKKLAVVVHAFFNSSHLSATQQKTMLDDIQKILTDAGVGADDASGIITDLKKIADDTK
jgi:hypothetical protein